MNDRLHTTSEAAPLLGYKHKNAVLRLIKEKKIPAIRRGDGPRGRWLIRRSVIDRYLSAQRSNLDETPARPLPDPDGAAPRMTRTRRTRKPSLNVGRKHWV